MITITETALKHISKYLAKRGAGIGIRIGVKTTGCSGLAYILEYADAEAFEDHVFEHGDIKILVDKRSMLYLDGTEIDYHKEGLSSGFKFNNPKSRSVCGCGESFRI